MTKKPEIFKNERALASAGSGKTYTLVNRFIALCLNNPPERICALTFTKKSAAEFLDKILGRLSEAATDDSAARALSAEMEELSGCAPLGRKDFLLLLERVAKALPKLRLCTIDSFCASLVKSFAPELGLFGRVEILDDFAENAALKKAMEAVFDTLSKDDSLLREFSETVKKASFGKEEKTVFKSLVGFVDDLLETWLKYPDETLWGNESAFEDEIGDFDSEAYLADLDELRLLDDKNIRQIVKYFEDARPGTASPSKTKIIPQLAEFWRNSGGCLGGAEYELRGKTYGLSAKASALLERIIDNLLGGELRLLCNSAGAIAKILKAWREAYARTSLARGRMSFSDMPVLLTAPQNRLAADIVEYRLDAKTDHWLFDEFQDTSRAQWKVFENLIGEVLQEGGGGRTFYYVGDVKQSIYSWRGGDPDLFEEIFCRYAPNIEAAKPMNVSYRSVPCVISTVNGLFGDEALIRGHYADSAADKWFGFWQNHISKFDIPGKSAAGRAETAGCSAFVDLTGDDPAIDSAKCIYRLLSEMKLRDRKLSCAILTQNNKDAKIIAETLRETALSEGNADFPPVSGEFDKNVVSDNPTGCAVRALAELLAHPEDSAARGLLSMTPLIDFVGKDFGRIDELRRISQNYGYAAVAEAASEFLRSRNFASDAFTAERLGQICKLARAFDRAGGRDPEEFVGYLDSSTVRETSAPGTVQIMTIHKSKGLDFDVVFLPDLGKNRMEYGFGVIGSGNKRAVINLSGGITQFSKQIYEARQAEAIRADFDSLCKFYVASTRAKRALYFIRAKKDSPKGDEKKEGKAPPPEGIDSDFSKLAFEYFSSRPKTATAENEYIYYDNGSDKEWFKKLSPPEARKAKEKAPSISDEPEIELCAAAAKYASRLEEIRLAPQLRPSGGADAPGGDNPAKDSLAAEEGALAHKALSYCGRETSPAGALSKCADAISEGAPSDETKRRVLKMLEEFFSDENMFGLFLGKENVEVRTEEPFLAATARGMVSGVFDRLEISRDSSGAAQSARILEFKTDSQRVSREDFLSRHATQARLYAEGAAALLGLPPDKISVLLVSIRGRFAVEVSSGK